MMDLTSKQKKVYLAIESYIKSKGIPPTVREIGEIIGEKAPGAVQGVLKRLEQKGAIKRGVGMARSIQLVSDTSNYAESVFVPEIKKISARNINDLLNLYNINKYHPVSSELLNNVLPFFAIRDPDNDKRLFFVGQSNTVGLSAIALYKERMVQGVSDSNGFYITYPLNFQGNNVKLTEIQQVGKIIGFYQKLD